MKVSNKPSGPMQNAESLKTKSVKAESVLENAKPKAAALDGANLASSAKVDLSSRAQEIRKAKELATPKDGIDEAKVARLQAMIDKGEYKVNAEAIADKLVDEQMKMPF